MAKQAKPLLQPLEGIKGPLGRLYADPQPGPNPTSFQVDNTSAQYYQSPYYLAHQKQTQPIPPRRHNAPLSLDDFLPTDTMAKIRNAGKILFHAVGDTGAAKVSRSQSVATAIGHEDAVSDAMAKDVTAAGDLGPAFFFHLGDVIYNFGEEQYYYDQFYDPYRTYDRPIFAIPGNHDGVVFGSGATPQVPSLQAFVANFCAAAPAPAPDAGALIRSLMTQPGVYFTLDAPFVSVIGLYSNVLEGPGVISSQGGHFGNVGDDQLVFLKSELSRLKALRATDPRAVVLAVHHPTASVDARHAGSVGIEADIDGCCRSAGMWPDMVLHGHAHLYQRFTRKLSDTGKLIPYLISGSGGFAATRPVGDLHKAPYTAGEYTLEIDPIVDFGYLTLETDGRTYLSAVFKVANTRDPVHTGDSISLNLATGKLTSQGATAAATAKLRRPGQTGASGSAQKKARRRRTRT